MPERSKRRAALTARFGDLKIDSLVASHLPNVRYLTGFTGSNAVLVVTPEHGAVMFTDSRYEVQAAQQVDCPTVITRGTWKAAAGWLKRKRARQIGFEAAHVTVEERDWFVSYLGQGGPPLAPVGRVVDQQRMVKSADEIERISHAVQINSLAYAAALARYKAGMTERELAAEIDYQMRRGGADDTAFYTIVASAAQSALPHAHPTGAAIAPNRLLLIDMGTLFEGYASDMTRVVVPGRIAPADRRLYAAVLEAQLAAIDAVKPGVTAGKIDAAARSTLKKHSLDALFKHSTGHGLGLEIHEAPRLGKGDKTKLQAGMVITIEPGAYRPGQGGVRIEDTLLVTESGCRVLTPTAKQLVAV
ncbi:MAG: aminopeptidase P family protein [Acidobacteria bacterium]|nr:aminopeptidase P family protein [Acidobacteriota bacterium]